MGNSVEACVSSELPQLVKQLPFYMIGRGEGGGGLHVDNKSMPGNLIPAAQCMQSAVQHSGEEKQLLLNPIC